MALQDAEEVGAAARSHTHKEPVCLLTRWACAAGRVTHGACLPAPAPKLASVGGAHCAPLPAGKRSIWPSGIAHPASAILELHMQHLPLWNCTSPAHHYLVKLRLPGWPHTRADWAFRCSGAW